MALEPPPAPDEVPRTHRAAITDLLARYGLALTGEDSAVAPRNALSDSSDYYRVQTNAGPRVVRVYRKGHRLSTAEVEMGLVAWVGKRGIPTVGVLPDTEGRTLHALSGLVLSLEPAIDGVRLQLATATPEQWHEIGTMLGRIHATLAGYRGELPNGDGPAWDTGGAVGELSRVDDLIRYYRSPGEEQLRVQAALRVQLGLLESGAARPHSDFDELPRQPVHGDYRRESVLFDGETVVAVVAWGSAAQSVAIHELARSIAVSGLTHSDLIDEYLRGYTSAHAIAASECAAGVDLTWQVLLHDTRAYHARFIQGDRRANPLELAAIIEEWRSPSIRRMLAEKLSQFAL